MVSFCALHGEKALDLSLSCSQWIRWPQLLNSCLWNACKLDNSYNICSLIITWNVFLVVCLYPLIHRRVIDVKGKCQIWRLHCWSCLRTGSEQLQDHPGLHCHESPAAMSSTEVLLRLFFPLAQARFDLLNFLLSLQRWKMLHGRSGMNN